jgi:7-cyano-7-deazaguanine synthase
MAQMTLERPELEVVTPLLELELWQVIDLGVQLDAPLQLTWSCESNVGEPCGDCRRCRERDAAFQRSGRADPTRVKQKATA